MDAKENQFEVRMRDGKIWKLKANQTAFCQLEKLTGLPLSLALKPKMVTEMVTRPVLRTKIDPDTGRVFHEPVIDADTGLVAEETVEVDRAENRGQLLILYALSAEHRAREALDVRFTFDPDRDPKENYRGPFFTTNFPTEQLQEIMDKANKAILADHGIAPETYAEKQEQVPEEDEEGNRTGPDLSTGSAGPVSSCPKESPTTPTGTTSPPSS